MGEYKFIPSGDIGDSNQHSILVNEEGTPEASCVEILPELPAEQNFLGRVVYDTSIKRTYIYNGVEFIPLEGEDVIIGMENPNPFTRGVLGELPNGALYWNSLTQTLFIKDNRGIWEAIMGSGLGATIIGSQSYEVTGTNNQRFSIPVDTNRDSTIDEIEVFIDGVRQYPIEDYNLVSNVVVLNESAPRGTKVLIRAISAISTTSNSNIVESISTGDGSVTDFNIGQSLTNTGSVMVFVNGELRPSTEYDIINNDVKISNIEKSGTGDSAEIVLTVNANIEEHNFTTNSIIRIYGLLTNHPFAFYENKDLTVKSVANTQEINPTSSTITIAADSEDGISSNISDSIDINNYDVIILPRTRSDSVRFETAPISGANIIIRSFKGVINGITKNEGATVTELDEGNNYQIPSGSNLTFIGVDTTSTQFIGGDITINIFNISNINGREITIKDVGGGTSGGSIEHNIVIESKELDSNGVVTTNSRPIDNVETYTIDKALGYVTLIYASNKWNVISKG